MDVNVFMVFELFHEFLCLLERLLERVRVSPCEVGRVRLCVEVGEGVAELDLEVALVRPAQRPLASFPLHRVWTHSVDRSQPHLVKLSLCSHTFDIESECLAVARPLDTEVEPGMVVAFGRIRQPIATHPTCVGVFLAVLVRVTLA